MNISVLDFFKFASRVPQIAQILVSTFNISGGACPRTLLEISSFFSMSNSRLWSVRWDQLEPRGLIHETDLRRKLRPKHEVHNYRRKVAIHESGQREVAT